MKVKFCVCAAATLLVLMASSAFGQEISHFDISGNLSYQGATLPSAPSGSTDVHTYGWQTTGVTHVSRWFAIASQFGGSSSSANSISLIGYTGPGTMREYSMLAGPRITIPTHSRFSPFLEGIAGGDYTSTKMTSNGTVVNGSQYAIAYAVGGGAQIDVSRHFGLNFEGQYLRTEDSLAFTGWQPAHFQVAAGLVIRMFVRRPQIAEERTAPRPPASEDSQPPAAVASENAEPVVPPSETVMTVRPTSTAVATPIVVEPQTFVASPVMAAAPQPAPVTPAAAPVAAAAIVSAPPSAPVPVAAPVVPAASPVVAAAVVSAPAAAPVPAPPATASAAPAFAEPASQVADAQPQTQPFSLGEYARRLREKKQQKQ
jgi:hypothetical protein